MIRSLIAFLTMLHLLSALHADTLNVQLRWYHQFQFAGYYTALEKGFYAQNGLEVRLIEGGPSVNVTESVLSGSADYGISNSSLVLKYLQGAPVVMLGAIFQHSPNILLAQKDFKSPVDLARDGTVGLMGGDQDVELKAVFVHEGIALDKVRFVPNHNHLKDLIDANVSAINAYSSNEPYELMQRNIAYQIIEPRSYGLDFYGDLIFTTQENLQADPQRVEAFRAATMQGWAYALDHPEEIVDLILRTYNTQNKTREHLLFEAQALKKLINPDFVQIGHSNPGRWEHIVETYRMFGLAQNGRSLDAFYYTPERHVDMTWFYLYLGGALGLAMVLGGVASYIFRINRRLEKSARRHRILFENSASAGFVWRDNGIITDWNIQAQTLFGWSKEEVLGRNFYDLMVPKEEYATLKRSLGAVLENYELYVGVNKNRTKTGKVIMCEWHNTRLPRIDENQVEVVSLAIDVTQRHRDTEQLRHLAHHDPLTQLPNRHAFEKALQQTHAFAKRHRHGYGLAFIDLDGFKAINDTFGHDAGDVLLQQLAKRFGACLRIEDTLARLGGDEFAVILSAASDIKTSNGVIKRLLETAARPVAYGNDWLEVSASIGVSFFSSQNDVAPEALMRQADTSMYHAKNEGKNRYSLYYTDTFDRLAYM